jgi:hypothetical protein
MFTSHNFKGHKYIPQNLINNNMKGIELPINALIIIILALIVLLAILGLFYGVWPSSTKSVNIETAKNNACQILISMRCLVGPETIHISDFDADEDGVVGDPGGWTQGTPCPTLATNGAIGDNLASLCACYYNTDNAQDCKTNVCGCST